MRTSNTGFFGPGDPIMRRGLSGLGALAMGDMVYGGGEEAYTAVMSTPPYVPGPNDSTPWYTDKNLWTAINSETLFFANLYRGMNNQAPLPASQYAPQVAVGLNADTQRLLVLGAVGLGAVMLMGGGKRRRRGRR